MTIVLVMLNAWKTPEEQNRHCTEFVTRTEIEVNHALPGKIQSGEIYDWRRRLGDGSSGDYS